jgi:hypothetical protein
MPDHGRFVLSLRLASAAAALAATCVAFWAILVWALVAPPPVEPPATEQALRCDGTARLELARYLGRSELRFRCDGELKLGAR